MSHTEQRADRAYQGSPRVATRSRGARATDPSTLDTILEQVPAGIIITDVTGCVRQMNPAAARIHGRAATDIGPAEWRLCHDVLRADGSPYGTEDLPVARALRREAVEREEWMARHPDGTLVRLVGSAAPLSDAHGRQIGAVVVTHDIPEREGAIEAIRAEATAKEQFFGHMSHELRTPVSAVLGYCALLLDGVAGPLPPAAAEMVGRVERNARHLNALVDDLLDLQRLDAAKVQLASDEVSLPALLRDTLHSLEPLARAKGIKLVLDAADAPVVRTDAKRVRQVVLNLTSNAVKFTESGEVRVEVEPQPRNRVAVHVTDTGRGIAIEDLERVFDEFVQVGAANGGTGLGLAISRRLARLLGGDLVVSSTLARGSRFTLTLPVLPLGFCAGSGW